VYAFGNPLTWGDEPPAPPAPALRMPPPAVAPPPPETLASLAPPPLGTSGFSVLVGTFDYPRDAARAESVLRMQNLPVYAIDLRAADGTVRRRLFAGRFATRDEATKAQQKVATVFTSARVTTAAEERLP
jgi:cell division septation protein DedD